MLIMPFNPHNNPIEAHTIITPISWMGKLRRRPVKELA